MSARRPRRQSGFVLAATLWVLAALTLAVGAYAIWARTALEEARALAVRQAARHDAFSARATLEYTLGVEAFDAAGLPPAPQTSAGQAETLRSGFIGVDEYSILPRGHEIRLDGRVYATPGGGRFAIQDTAGLLNADSGDDPRIDGLLGLLGISMLQRGPLLDKLLDYQDPDDLLHLNGAEAPQYKEHGLPPPPNRRLITSMEAYRVLDWPGVAALWSGDAWARYTTAAHFGPVNINTAPEAVLEAVPGINPTAARRIVAARGKAPFILPEQGLTAGGVAGVSALEFITYPARYLRLEFWSPGSAFVECYDLELTPQIDQGYPWTMVGYYLIPLQDAPQFRNEHPEPAPGYLFAAASDARQ